MEIMALPKKEMLKFSRDVNPWIIKDVFLGNKKIFIFKEDTPEDVLDLFDNLIPRLNFSFKVSFIKQYGAEKMVLPKQETLIYFNEIDDWIYSEEVTDSGVILFFEKNTPSNIIILFENIKDKLDFKIKDYIISD